MVIDWISVGLDPKMQYFYPIPCYNTPNYILLSMITPLSWLERCPTYKEQLKQLESKEINTYGFLGYPVLMATDIPFIKPTRFL